MRSLQAGELQGDIATRFSFLCLLWLFSLHLWNECFFVFLIVAGQLNNAAELIFLFGVF